MRVISVAQTGRVLRTLALATLTAMTLPEVQVSAASYAGEKSLTIEAGTTVTVRLERLVELERYALLIYLPSRSGLGEDDRFEVTVADAAGVGVSKTLHEGDADLYVTLQPTVSGSGTLQINDRRGPGGRALGWRYVNAPLPGRSDRDSAVQITPARAHWSQAHPYQLGTIAYATNDERPYLPPLDRPSSVLSNLMTGVQWFTFDYAGPDPKLAHFLLDVLDRDVPVDVSLFVGKLGSSGQAVLEPYWEGVERYNTEQSTKFHGLQKFIARVLQPGKYYLRVMGNHPFFQLRTALYDPPPYSDPAQAIRVGLDYLLRKGDSWHANTPRRGSVVLRASNRLGETAQCIACHPTHFTTRAELIAAENGWPVTERPALQFLTERLYNNPRPLYGTADAVWARMISAPGNVLSRLGYMLATYERTISLEQRHEVLEPIGAFLEHYWQGVESPITESNGNSPRISGFEVALHSSLVFTELHRRTGRDKYRDLERRVRQVIVDGRPLDMIDLCWKIIALSELDRPGFAPQIAQLVSELWSRQKPNGTWSVAFDRALEKDYRTGKDRPASTPKDPDGTPRGSEFQTYHALYALAKAGLPASDPRLAKVIEECLARQWPHGAWQGNPDFKNFDTVFRDTQYALMALTELFPGPGGHGWNAAFPPAPAPLADGPVASLLEQLDRHWTDPGTTVIEQARQLLSHPQPLVRLAAASLLGRVADPGSVPDLAHSLGDGSKLVQRGAAWALRQIASRRRSGHDQILAALRSPDDRVRWGALRIFNQHFKYLTWDWRLGHALIGQLRNDEVHVHRVQAAQALWQWWFWDASEPHRAAIEDAFLAGLATQEHPWVRRNLMEGLRNVIDDNVRYLSNDWIPALKDPGERERVKAGLRATASRQADKLAAALLHGTPPQRDGILRAFYAFHLRESTVDLDPTVAQFTGLTAGVETGRNDRGESAWIDGYKFAASFDPAVAGSGALGRIGNDTEPPTFYETSGPVLADALRRLLTTNGLVLPVLRTLSSSRGVPLDGDFSRALLELARQPGPDFGDAGRLLEELLPSRFTPSPQSTPVLASLIREESGPSLRLACEILRGPRGAQLGEEPALLASLEERILAANSSESDLGLLLGVLLRTPALQPVSQVRTRLMELSHSPSTTLKQLALRTLLQGDRFLLHTRARREFESDLQAADAARLKDWLAAVSGIDGHPLRSEAATQRILGVVTTGLTHQDPHVQRAAIQAVRHARGVGDNPAVREILRSFSASLDPQVRQDAHELLQLLEGPASDPGAARAAPVDFDYFVQHVQPILQKEAADGDSCARCHANHSILKLIPQPDGQPLSEKQSRDNYLSAMKVIDPARPEESLLLIKPRSSFEGIGQPENYRRTHGGDVRWPKGTESEEHAIILRWIRGAQHHPSSNPADHEQLQDRAHHGRQ